MADKLSAEAKKIRNICSSHVWFSEKISMSILDRFLQTAKFKNGVCVHMEYGEIENHLSTREFNDFLRWLGITEPKFLDYQNSICSTNAVGSFECFHNPGTYCDPAQCHD